MAFYGDDAWWTVQIESQVFNDNRRSHPYLTILFVSSMATLISSSPLALWKRATPSRPPARRRNPPPFLCCKLNSREHAPVLGSERLDHLGLLSHSSVSPPVRAPELLPGPELGLLSVLFVLTAVILLPYWFASIVAREKEWTFFISLIQVVIFLGTINYFCLLFLV